jgi:hypothetical protein
VLLGSPACNWLSLFLCLRGTSNNKKAIHQIHPNQKSFDAVVVWKGSKGDDPVTECCVVCCVMLVRDDVTAFVVLDLYDALILKCTKFYLLFCFEQ